MKAKRLLDSFAVLAYLRNEKGCEQVRQLLASENNTLFINEINLGEVYYIIGKALSVKEADYFIKTIFPSLPINSIGNTFENVLEAAKIKARYSLSYADCFVAATAIREKMPIVTGDPEFKEIEKLAVVEWL